MIEIKSKMQQKQVAPEAKKPTPKNGKASQKEYVGIRIRGIPESEATDARSRADEDMQKVIHLLDVMDVKCPISDLRRLGKYVENKNRPLVLRVSMGETKNPSFSSQAQRLRTQSSPKQRANT